MPVPPSLHYSPQSHSDAIEPTGATPTLHAPPLALYVHFPWCVRKCPYCDFNSYALDGAQPLGPYLERLECDLTAQAHAVAGRELISVFLGGGTPSLFSPEQIGRLLQHVGRHYVLACDAEVTLEANPGTVERGAFRDYRAAGVTRVSLGAQSFAPQSLALLGRVHSPADTLRAAEELHAADLTNFNLDLMYALPGQDPQAAARDVEQALALAPAHISHYQLTLEAGTVFGARPPPGIPDDDTTAAMLEECATRLAQAGFERYEVSAYARPKRQSRHNTNYWKFGDYLGVGAGAHGKLTEERSQQILRTAHTREPRRYLASSDGALSRRPIASQDLPFEFMLNALRLTGGFARADFEGRTGLSWRQVEPRLEAATSRGLVVPTPDGYRPTALGLSFVNELLLQFIPVPADVSGPAARHSPGLK